MSSDEMSGKSTQDMIDKAMKRAAEASKVLATHTVAEGETLGGIAMKYYKSADKEKWMAIYLANKAVIGDNPNLIKPGQELKIPEL